LTPNKGNVDYRVIGLRKQILNLPDKSLENKQIFAQMSHGNDDEIQ